MLQINHKNRIIILEKKIQIKKPTNETNTIAKKEPSRGLKIIIFLHHL